MRFDSVRSHTRRTARGRVILGLAILAAIGFTARSRGASATPPMALGAPSLGNPGDSRRPRAGAPSAVVPLDTAALEASVRDEMRATRTPGVAVAIVLGDSVVYAKGFGVASIETGAPVTPDMLFRVGSVTKMFTGLTAAMLANSGRVDLRAPIGRYAKGLHATLGRVTLDQLLSHTGGMTNEAAGDGPHDDAALGVRMRSWGAEHTFATPGDIYSYSGPGYWLAGYAIEQAAGAPYADVVQREVLVPLGMTRSTFRPLAAMTWPLALDHRVANDSVRLLRPYPDDATTWPSGSLFSTARDLSRLAIALMHEGRVGGRQAIPPDVVRVMHTRHASVPGGDCGYTYGLSDCTRDGMHTLSHYGFRIGSGAVFTIIPDQKFAVIILANRNGAIFGRTERVAMNLLLPARQASRDAEPRSVPLDAAARRRFAGVYASYPDTLRLVARGDSLRFRYGSADQLVRGDANDPDAILVVNDSGDVEQQFMLVRGRDGRTEYLHDGLNAFRRVGR
jgi:CubicO group peptidase (beta-lactamase class C family)